MVGVPICKYTGCGSLGGGLGEGSCHPNFSSRGAGYAYVPPLNHLAYQHVCPPPQEKFVAKCLFKIFTASVVKSSSQGLSYLTIR